MDQPTIARLQERFSIPGVAQIVAGQGGLPMIRVRTAAASAEVYLHGAQVTSWEPSGAEEVLFLSRQSRWEEGRAIRGGIPICFPWFRAKADSAQAPAHGVVRTRPWRLDAIAEEGNVVTITLSTESDEASRRWWPHEFHLAHRITVGADLTLELTVTHTGGAENAEDAAPMLFEEALHTYFSVGDATQVRVAGLDGVTYLDNMDQNREKVQQGDVTYTQQTDNAYLDTGQAVELVDPLLRRRIRTTKASSATTVVWNPWKQGAEAMADLGDEEWQRMACVEASNILHSAVVLGPGRQHTMTARLSLRADTD